MKKIFLFSLFFALLFTVISCGRVSNSWFGASDVSESGEGEKGEWPPKLGEVEVVLETDPLKRNFYAVFDGSGSMGGNKVVTAKDAFQYFVDQVPEDANIGLLVFDTQGTTERAALGTTKSEIKAQIEDISAGGGTPLSTAVAYAYEQLTLQGHKQLGYGEYHLVIVTDGAANDEHGLKRTVDNILAKSPVMIHTIGFKIGDTHSLNQPGRILYKSANNFDELAKGLEGVLAESEDFAVLEFKE